MKQKKIDLSPERKLIVHLITSTSFCREIIPLLRIENLRTSYCREVASWVVEYYGEYKEAPQSNIQELYRSKKEGLRDEEDLEIISELLQRLSDEWEKSEILNVSYSVQQAIIYLKLRSLEVLKKDLERALIEKDHAKGEQCIATYARIEKPIGEGTNLLKDSGKVISAFLEDEEHMIRFPGALGTVAGNINRGDFVAFLAPMKRGKTWWLWFTAELAMSAGWKVLFFSLEMTEKQMIRRAWMSLVGSPRNKETVTIPYFEYDEDNEQYKVEIKSEERKGVDTERISEIQKKLKQRYRKGEVKIISIPSKSAAVDDIRTYLDNLEHYENFIPDVIIVDYADLLKSGDKFFRGEYRHKLDDIWSHLRRISQERNCVVVTASQAEKSSFDTDISKKHWAEDIRKMAHITCGLALNQRKSEAKNGIMRVSQIAIREGREEFRQALVLSCLAIGRPYLDSKFSDEVFIEEEENGKRYHRK